MYSMPRNWTERQIQRLVGPDVEHPLATTERRVAWENADLRLECNVVRNTATLEDQLAVRITPAVDPYYGAVVVPLDREGRVILIGHYRYPIGRWSIEFPRFAFNSSEAGWKEAAAADLARMTGLAADRMRLLGAIQIDPALVSTSTVVLLAEGCAQEGAGASESEAPKPGRLIAGSIVVSPDELSRLVSRGDVACGVTLAALALYRSIRR
jgi:hypothetical protein